jgi:hypothetical protein
MFNHQRVKITLFNVYQATFSILNHNASGKAGEGTARRVRTIEGPPLNGRVARVWLLTNSLGGIGRLDHRTDD